MRSRSQSDPGTRSTTLETGSPTQTWPHPAHLEGDDSTRHVLVLYKTFRCTGRSCTGHRRKAPMLTLYLSPGSSSMAPHIALHEIGVDFESRWISFAKREQYAPEYLKLNPEGKVPTLLVDGHPLTEVAAILYYLAKRFPKAGLFAEGDLEAEAQVVSWMSFIASTIHPARMIGVERWKEVFEIAENRLARKEWAV